MAVDRFLESEITRLNDGQYELLEAHRVRGAFGTLPKAAGGNACHYRVTSGAHDVMDDAAEDL